MVTADHPLVSQAIDELRNKGSPVVAFATGLSAASRAGFVGTDNWPHRRMVYLPGSHEPGKVFPLISGNRYQCQDISDASFRSYLREHTPHLQVNDTLLTHEEPGNVYKDCA